MKQNFAEKSQASVHMIDKEETSGVIPAMSEIPCQCTKTVTKGNMKITITYPQKGNVQETELVREVKHMMETIIMQQIEKTKEG